MLRKNANNTVALLYRTILGREPDPAGLAQYAKRLAFYPGAIGKIIREFAESPEYAQKKRLLTPNLTQFQSFPETDVFLPPEVVGRLFEKTSFYWRNAASNPGEMYLSVLTEKEWHRELTVDDRIRFIQTGKSYSDRVLDLYENYSGRSAANLTCIDFGSGVGRLAINFVSRVAQVHAVDFSEAHLEELQRNAEMLDCASRITPWPLRQPADLENLPQVDLVYSFLSLQHNTPPVIAAMMRALLDHLQPGGYAFLHVTLAASGYGGFKVDDYLDSDQSGTEMEVHILPRANINSLVAMAGCELLTSHCVGGNDYAYSEEIVIRKPA